MVKITKVDMFEIRMEDGTTILRTRTLPHAKSWCKEKGEPYRVTKEAAEAARNQQD